MTREEKNRSASLFANDHAKALVLEIERDPGSALAMVRAAIETLEDSFYHRPVTTDEGAALYVAYRRGVAAAALVYQRSSGAEGYLARRADLLAAPVDANLLGAAYSMLRIAPTVARRMDALVAQVETGGEAALREALMGHVGGELHRLRAQATGAAQ